MKGKVTITAKSGVKLEISDNAVLENKVKHSQFGFRPLYFFSITLIMVGHCLMCRLIALLCRISMALRTSKFLVLDESESILKLKIKSCGCAMLDYSDREINVLLFLLHMSLVKVSGFHV